MRPRAAGLCLAAVLLGSLLVRWQFIGLSLPYVLHVDESVLARGAANMFRTGELNPQIYLYPALPTYLAGAGYWLGHALAGLSRLDAAAYPAYPAAVVGGVARGLFAILSVVAIWVACRLPRTAFGLLRAEVPVALLLAACPLFFYHSWAYLNVDIVGCLFSVAAVCVALERSGRDDVFSKAVLPGALVGLAVASKYQLALVGLAPAAAILLHADRKAVRLAQLAFWSAVFFVVACPYFVLDFAGYWGGIEFQRSVYASGHRGYEGEAGLAQASFHARQLAGQLGPVVCAAAAIGLAWTFRADRRKAVVLAVFPAALFLLMAAQRVNVARNLLPVYVIVPVYAAIGIVAVHGALRGRIGSVPAAAALGLALLAGAPWSELRTQYALPVESRKLAVEWIRAHVPPRSRLVVARELDMQLAALRRDYEIDVFDGLATPPDKLRRLVEEREASAYFIVPRYGVDARWPGYEQTAKALDEAFAGVAALAAFGSRDVLVNYSVAVPGGDPRLVVGLAGGKGVARR